MDKAQNINLHQVDGQLTYLVQKAIRLTQDGKRWADKGDQVRAATFAANADYNIWVGKLKEAAASLKSGARLEADQSRINPHIELASAFATAYQAVQAKIS